MQLSIYCPGGRLRDDPGLTLLTSSIPIVLIVQIPGCGNCGGMVSLADTVQFARLADSVASGPQGKLRLACGHVSPRSSIVRSSGTLQTTSSEVIASNHARFETLEEGLEIHDTCRNDAQILYHLRAHNKRQMVKGKIAGIRRPIEIDELYNSSCYDSVRASDNGRPDLVGLTRCAVQSIQR